MFVEALRAACLCDTAQRLCNTGFVATIRHRRISRHQSCNAQSTQSIVQHHVHYD
jgi:hypothetical protein